MTEKVKVGVFGLGLRGFSLLKHVCDIENVKVTALCDLYEERIERATNYMKEKNIELPKFCTDDYHKLIACDEVDVVMIFNTREEMGNKAGSDAAQCIVLYCDKDSGAKLL